MTFDALSKGMMMTKTLRSRGQLLVGDIGGTNARFALYGRDDCERGNDALEARATLAAADYRQFGDAVRASR